MKQKLKQIQSLTTTLQITQTMQDSLNILKMNQNELIEFINDICEKNPLIEYIPSTNMNQLIQENLVCETSLKNELYLQLHTTNQTYESKIANYIIESLDDNGFFSESIDEAAKILKVSPENFKYTLRIIQSFEPLGVAAQNAMESVCIQLNQKGCFTALKIFETYPDALMNKDFLLIAKKERKTIEQVKIYFSQIKSCNPYPCSHYNTNTTKIIIPDFSIQIDEKEISIIPKSIGHIQIYNNYKKQELNHPKLLDYFNHAHFFIDHLNKRNKTLLILANSLIDIQKSHFLYQDEIVPCTLRDIALATGFHESTVSRTLSNKYYEFQNEVYPVKTLFSSRTKEGTGKVSLLKSIQSMIENEDTNNPLTDEEIVANLEMFGLHISRRTVSKYRNILNIPNSKQRMIDDKINSR